MEFLKDLKPKVTFLTKILHTLINLNTGELDIDVNNLD